MTDTTIAPDDSLEASRLELARKQLELAHRKADLAHREVDVGHARLDAEATALRAKTIADTALQNSNLPWYRRRWFGIGQPMPQRTPATAAATPKKPWTLRGGLKKIIYTYVGVNAADYVDRLWHGQGPLDAAQKLLTDNKDLWSGNEGALYGRLTDPRVSMLTEAQFRDKLTADLANSGKATYNENGVDFTITKDTTRNTYTLTAQKNQINPINWNAPVTQLGTGSEAVVVGWASAYHYFHNPDHPDEYENSISNAVSVTPDSLTPVQRQYRDEILTNLKNRIQIGQTPPPAVQTSAVETHDTGTTRLANADPLPQHSMGRSPAAANLRLINANGIPAPDTNAATVRTAAVDRPRFGSPANSSMI